MNNTLFEEGALQGPFDRCLECQYLGSGCSGPRTSAMTFPRWIEWIKALRQLRRLQGWKVSYMDIAEATGLSKNTVDNVFAGKQKDVSRATAGFIEDYLIGGETRWPCSMDLNADKDIVYQDRPETLEALARRDRDMEQLHESYQKEIAAIRASFHQEMDTIRAEAQRKLDFIKNENDLKAAIIDKLLK